jgi:hypothetical protein
MLPSIFLGWVFQFGSMEFFKDKETKNSLRRISSLLEDIVVKLEDQLASNSVCEDGNVKILLKQTKKIMS